MPDCGVKCTAGSRAFIGEGAAQGIDIEADGSGEGPNGATVIQQVPTVAAEAILGQSLLGEGILCGYGWS